MFPIFELQEVPAATASGPGALGQDWALTPDGSDLDPAGRLASPVQTYLDRMYVVGVIPAGSLLEDDEVGAGLGQALGAGRFDPGSPAAAWQAQAERDECSSAVRVSGRIEGGALRLALSADTASGPVSLTAEVGIAGPRIVRDL